MIPVAGPFVCCHNQFDLALSLISWAQNNYASEVTQHLSNLGLYADVDNSAETLKKKIRNGEIAQYNFILGALYTLIYNDSIACMFIKHMFFFHRSGGWRGAREPIRQRQEQGRHRYQSKRRKGATRRDRQKTGSFEDVQEFTEQACIIEEHEMLELASWYSGLMII